MEALLGVLGFAVVWALWALSASARRIADELERLADVFEEQNDQLRAVQKVGTWRDAQRARGVAKIAGKL